MSEKRKEIIREWNEMDTELRPEILDKWKVTPPKGYLESLEARLIDLWSVQASDSMHNGDNLILQNKQQTTGIKILPTNRVMISMAAVMCCILAALFFINISDENDSLQIDDDTALMYLEEDLAGWEVADLVYADVLEDHHVLYDDINLDEDNLESLEAELLDEELLVE